MNATNLKHSPIQKKIMTLIMMTSGIVLIMTCSAFFFYEYVSARDNARRELSALARVIALNSTAAISFQSTEDATRTLATLDAKRNILAACLFDTLGRVFAKYPADAPEQQFPKPPFIRGYEFQRSTLSGFEPVIVEGQLVGILYISSDVSQIHQRFLLYAIIAIVFIIISFLFAYFVSRRLQKSISEPIRALSDVSRVVSEERKYSVRANIAADDEFAELTEAFNHMLTRIEQQNDEIIKLNHSLEQKVKDRTSELETALHELLKQTEFSGKIFDSTIDLIAVFDTELRFVTMNTPSEQLYRKSREEIRGKYLAELFPQTIKSGMIDDLREALKGEVVRRMNYRSVVTRRVYENYYVPLKDHDDEVYSVMAIAHDITDIIQANEKLQHLNSELEKSNGELEQFAYVASHDLQEPLRKIQTFTELSERNISNPEIQKKYLEKVGSSAQRMTELIKAVLNYSRLARTEKLFERVDLDGIINNIFSDLELMITEKHATFEVGDLPVIKGIPLQIHQLFLNLITNAIKFNEGRPHLKINSRVLAPGETPASLGLNPDQEYLLLQFSDNGIGFDQKFSDKVFSIFQRLHNDRNFSGTGIGLALCKKIVENHEGAITVQSEPDRGTTFFIYLPFEMIEETQLTNTSSTNT
jgi:PAS domain S-box-containing protein